MSDQSVSAILEGLVGLWCSRVDNPHGSVVRFDIGPLGRREDDAPGSLLHGWRHLTVLSPWRIESHSEVIGDWNLSAISSTAITELVQPVVGHTIVAIGARAPGWDLSVEWSNGMRLRVFGDSNEFRDDAWVILGTDGLELGAGPRRPGRNGIEIKGAPR